METKQVITITMKYSNKTIPRAEDTGKEKFESCIHPFSGFSTSQLFHFHWLFVLSKLNTGWHDDATSHVSQFHFPQQAQTTTATANYTILMLPSSSYPNRRYSYTLFAFLLIKRTPLQRMTSFLLNIIHVYSVERF